MNLEHRITQLEKKLPPAALPRFTTWMVSHEREGKAAHRAKEQAWRDTLPPGTPEDAVCCIHWIAVTPK